MELEIRAFEKRDLPEMTAIWNQVVEDGAAFPQMELLDENSGEIFFSEQSFTGVAYDVNSGEIAGLYILHPNNVGRCGHICNASYAVKRRSGDSISERSWCCIVWLRRKNWGLACFSLMRW